MSILQIVYIVSVKPFVSIKLNKLEVFNELCILLVNYHLIFFTDFIPNDPLLKYQIGWSIMSISTLSIVVNMIIIFKDLVT